MEALPGRCGRVCYALLSCSSTSSEVGWLAVSFLSVRFTALPGIYIHHPLPRRDRRDGDRHAWRGLTLALTLSFSNRNETLFVSDVWG